MTEITPCVPSFPCPLATILVNSCFHKEAPGNTTTSSSLPPSTTSTPIPKSLTWYSANPPGRKSPSIILSPNISNALEPAAPFLIPSTNCFKSNPARFAKIKPSLSPTKFAPIVIWFAILQLCPHPAGPT
ncbi:hypothetical protein V8G54_005058 [Vigna mungo]|uniref:Uncharacterized protein n=1 Tax=Vigna mungo TaxID=3915 RepID=A0AAQ3SBQ4_VIGMU